MRPGPKLVLWEWAETGGRGEGVALLAEAEVESLG